MNLNLQDITSYIMTFLFVKGCNGEGDPYDSNLFLPVHIFDIQYFATPKSVTCCGYFTPNSLEMIVYKLS